MMKFRIALIAAGTLLTLASAVSSSTSGTLRSQPLEPTPSAEVLSVEVTPEMIASWRMSAHAREYVAPKRPL
jgi:hypothetical protein